MIADIGPTCKLQKGAAFNVNAREIDSESVVDSQSISEGSIENRESPYLSAEN